MGKLQPRRPHPGRHPQRVVVGVSGQDEPSESLGVVLGPYIGGQLGQRPGVGRTLPALRRSDDRWAARLGAAAGDARAIGQHDAVHRVGAQAGQDQGDIGAQAPAQQHRRAQVPQRSVGVGHEDLRRVATSAGYRRCPVAGEVQPVDGTGPRLDDGTGRIGGCRLAQAVEEEQVGAVGVDQTVQRQLDASVAQHGRRCDGGWTGSGRRGHDRNSKIRSATRSGASMCTKWPTPSNVSNRAPDGR